MKTFWITRIAKGIVFLLLFGALFGYVVMGLWNWLMPALFGLQLISFWQAIGLILLCKLLFGGHGMHRWRGKGWATHRWKHSQEWKKKFEEKLSHMSPEERERVKAMWERRCRMWGYNSPQPENSPPPVGETKL